MTPIQDLREDLVLSRVKSLVELDKINDPTQREVAKEVLNITIDGIIKRIDEELLGTEKETIVKAFDKGDMTGRADIVRQIDPDDEVVMKYPVITGEQYYDKISI